MRNEIDEITRELFKWDSFNDSIYTDEVDDECRDKASKQIEEYGWSNVWESWYEYLITNCKNARDVCNFASLFYTYDGPSYPINNPYEFLGYIYYYLDLCSSKYEEEYNALTIMDGVTMDVLENSGIKKDLWLDTSYVPEKDQNIIDSVEEWKKKEKLKAQLDILFKQNFFSDDFDPEGEFPEKATELLNSYPWESIYRICFEHLTTNCSTEEELYNALNLYYIYSFAEKPIDNPYELIGFILYRIDIEKHWDKYGEFIDTLTISIIDNSLGSNQMADGYYRVWEDPKTIEAIEFWKSQFANN